MEARRTRTTNEFNLAQLLERQSRSSTSYLEFLRYPAFSVGTYVLDAGVTDTQTTHSEDEVYFVIGGRARLMLEENGATRTIEASEGKIIFVAAHTRHSFYNITDPLHLLVFFAPAENPSNAPVS